MPARLHNVNVPKTQVMLYKRNADPLSPTKKVYRARPSDTFWNMCKTGKINFLAQGMMRKNLRLEKCGLAKNSTTKNADKTSIFLAKAREVVARAFVRKSHLYYSGH